MTTREELEKRVRASGALADRLTECARRIGLMCSEGRCPKMSIPVRWDDDDFFISTTLQDARIEGVQRKVEGARTMNDQKTQNHAFARSLSNAGLGDRISELEKQHGSLRAAAKVLGCDAGYLSRLRFGEKDNPSAILLKRMGLKRVISYERIKSPNVL